MLILCLFLLRCEEEREEECEEEWGQRDITFDEIFDNARFVAPILATCAFGGARARCPTLRLRA